MFIQDAFRSRRSTTAMMLTLAFASAMASASAAQDYRDDPFQPTMSAAEDRKAQDRARLKDALRELFPEIRSSMIQPELSAARSQIIEEAKKAAISAIKSDPSFTRGASDPSPVSSPDGKPMPIVDGADPRHDNHTVLPQSAEFVACINGKALYRDKKSSLNFFREVSSGAPTPCEPIEANSDKAAAPPPIQAAAPMATGVGRPLMPARAGYRPPMNGMPLTRTDVGAPLQRTSYPNPASRDAPNQ